MRHKTLPSARVLRRLINYCPETGKMVWKERPVWLFVAKRYSRETGAKYFNRRYAGQPALQAVTKLGYCEGQIFGKGTFAHRVAWKMFYGTEPDGMIDHINGVRTDNRISNIRVVDAAGNCRNICLPKNNKSGVIGVSWDRAKRKWSASIRHERKTRHLGYFNGIEDAALARKQAELKYGFHPNHGKAKEA